MVKKTVLLLLMVLLCLFMIPLENTYAVVYTVTASVKGGNGSVTPLTQKIKPNERATITVKPDTGYHLESIIDNGQKMTPTTKYAIPYVNEDHLVEFIFAINIYSVTAVVSGGHGKVDPPKQDIVHGEKATITITPDEGYKITSITDNGNPIAIVNPLFLSNVTTKHAIVVGFVSFTVTASVIGSHGTVSPLTQTIGSGGRATIIIKPDIGYQIDKIIDNDIVVKTTNPYIISNIRSNRKIVVSFTTAVLSIKASVVGGHGSVSPGTVSVLYGDSVSINITPDDGYHVTGITDNGVSKPLVGIYRLTEVKEDHVIVVSFVEFDIYARMIMDNGVITPERQTMFYGGRATITIEPDAGYLLSYVTDNGKKKNPTTPTTYVIDNITEDHLVDIYFIAITFTVTAIVSGGFGVASPSVQTVRYGSQCTLNFTAYPGYRITGIMDNGKAKIASTPYLIKSVTEDHTVIVTFLTYAVFASVTGGNGFLTPNEQYVGAGGKASLIMIPEAGYRIDQIIDNDVIMPTTKSPYVIPSVFENHSIEVKFAINTFTITVSVPGGNGSVSPATQTVTYFEKATLKIKPDPGYRIESIVDNGYFVPIWNPYSIHYVTEDHKILIKFVKIK